MSKKENKDKFKAIPKDLKGQGTPVGTIIKPNLQ